MFRSPPLSGKATTTGYLGLSSRWPRPLAGAREKVCRARKQFDSLKAEIKPWVEGQPQFLWVRCNEETQRWSCALVYRGHPAPLRFAVIIGEIIHDLRSALDHLIWQLVLANPKGNGPSEGTQFPIYTTSHLRDRKHWRDRTSRWNKMLGGVDPTDRGTIKALQPYRRAHRVSFCSLAELVDLSNTDKHNLLVTTVVGMVREPRFWPLVSLEPVAGASYEDVAFADPPAGSVWAISPNSTELMSFRMAPPDAHPNVAVNKNLAVTIAFGEGLLPIDDILNLADEVTTILDYFERVIG